jgi:hemoglobin
MQMEARNEPVPLLRQGDGLTVDEQRPFGASRGVSRSPANTHTDLDTRAQIHNMVVAFYRELVMDEILGPIFEEVAEVDWSEHIPQLIDYWCRVLLGDRSYREAILAAHRHVHDQLPVTTEHFDRWYGMFASTIDQQWSGPYADIAKAHAARIAASLARQLPRIAWEPTPSPESSSIF